MAGRRRVVTVAGASVVAPDAPTLDAPAEGVDVYNGVAVAWSASVTAGQVPDRIDLVLDPGGSEVVVATDSTSTYGGNWTPSGVAAGAHTLVARFVYGSGTVDSAATNIVLFDPTVLATTKLWLDPSVLTAGAIVGWPDSGPQGYDLDLGAATAEAAGLSGLPSVLFNGSSDFLAEINGVALEVDGSDTPYTLISSLQWLGGAGSGVMAAFGRESTAANGRTFLWSISGNRSIFRADDAASSVSPNPGGAWGASALVASKVFAGTTMAYYQDGVEVMAATACDVGACSFTRFSLGATATGTPASFGNVRFGDIVLLTGAPDATDRGRVEAWMMAKLGL